MDVRITAILLLATAGVAVLGATLEGNQNQPIRFSEPEAELLSLAGQLQDQTINKQEPDNAATGSESEVVLDVHPIMESKRALARSGPAVMRFGGKRVPMVNSASPLPGQVGMMRFGKRRDLLRAGPAVMRFGKRTIWVDLEEEGNGS